jgi:hypothetical protein
MFRFFNTRPKYEDAAFADLSQMLFRFPQDPIFRSDLLKQEALDFSVASLQAIDDYLEAIRAVPPEGAAFQKVVLRAGAYVGEVIRKAGLEEDSHWIAHDGAARISPKTYGKLEKSMASIASLQYLAEVETPEESQIESPRKALRWFFITAARARAGPSVSGAVAGTESTMRLRVVPAHAVSPAGADWEGR